MVFSKPYCIASSAGAERNGDYMRKKKRRFSFVIPLAIIAILVFVFSGKDEVRDDGRMMVIQKDYGTVIINDGFVPTAATPGETPKNSLAYVGRDFKPTVLSSKELTRCTITTAVDETAAIVYGDESKGKFVRTYPLLNTNTLPLYYDVGHWYMGSYELTLEKDFKYNMEEIKTYCEKDIDVERQGLENLLNGGIDNPWLGNGWSIVNTVMFDGKRCFMIQYSYNDYGSEGKDQKNDFASQARILQYILKGTYEDSKGYAEVMYQNRNNEDWTVLYGNTKYLWLRENSDNTPDGSMERKFTFTNHYNSAILMITIE